VKPRIFFAFVAPSLVLMVMFIAFPLVSVFVQSFQNRQAVFKETIVEKCTPGFPNPVCNRETVLVQQRDEAGRVITRTEFVGLDNYRKLLRTDEIGRLWDAGTLTLKSLLAINFFHALRFTLTFTFITLPFVIGLGLAIALALNAVTQRLKGVIIFASLLPFIITPVIGALSIRWLFAGDGILTVMLRWALDQPFSMFAQGWTIEAIMIFYRIWHVAPFAFLIFYAGLQTLNQDTLESSIVDGASRFERLRYVILPHLMPLIIFVTLIHLMDSYRVFDEVVGFASQAHVISLQWLTFDLLTPDNTGNRAIGRASASSMLTMLGIVLLLIPLLRRTWRDHRSARQG
jgi:multiple sugar transport system permease protein